MAEVAAAGAKILSLDAFRRRKGLPAPASKPPAVAPSPAAPSVRRALVLGVLGVGGALLALFSRPEPPPAKKAKKSKTRAKAAR